MGVGTREGGPALEHLDDNEVVVGIREAHLVADGERGALDLRDAADHAGVEKLPIAPNAAAACPDLDDHRSSGGGMLRIAQHRRSDTELVVAQRWWRVIGSSPPCPGPARTVLVAHGERAIVDRGPLLLGHGLEEVARALLLGGIHGAKRCIEARTGQAQSLRSARVAAEVLRASA